ncbi:hypothetical protein NDU88_006678 [Pleurodeles waltl]|uniref:Uncharacterized protein n=1 Tax=Pleurodeles waltl TaxID=8319 RepID=A0AAV7X2D1_PLEWA|nr:hypothetical protein NDU88_006678 [Pleurodeles waltl]
MMERARGGHDGRVAPQPRASGFLADTCWRRRCCARAPGTPQMCLPRSPSPRGDAGWLSATTWGPLFPLLFREKCGSEQNPALGQKFGLHGRRRFVPDANEVKGSGSQQWPITGVKAAAASF